MDEIQHSADNPYRPPSANLTDQDHDWSDQDHDWTANTIMCAERYFRCQMLGTGTAIIILIFGRMTIYGIVSSSEIEDFSIET